MISHRPFFWLADIPNAARLATRADQAGQKRIRVEKREELIARRYIADGCGHPHRSA
jgi:hypothetical protein